MIIETSAVIAILRREPDARLYEDAIAGAVQADRIMSAASYQECGAVMAHGRRPEFSRVLDEFVTAARISIVPVTKHLADVARQAYWDFGKGSGHPAGLNFGDCFAYALAQDTGHALLWKGNDFTHTGIRSALD